MTELQGTSCGHPEQGLGVQSIDNKIWIASLRSQ